jgi:metal-sulfur cluster biosynthetic enzyme
MGDDVQPRPSGLAALPLPPFQEPTLATKEQVLEALATVNDPEIGKPITELGMVDDVVVDGGVVDVHVLLTVPGCPMKDRITADVTNAVQPLEGVEQVRVALGSMTDEQRQKMAQDLRGGAAQAPGGQPVIPFAQMDSTRRSSRSPPARAASASRRSRRTSPWRSPSRGTPSASSTPTSGATRSPG